MNLNSNLYKCLIHVKVFRTENILLFAGWALNILTTKLKKLFKTNSKTTNEVQIIPSKFADVWKIDGDQTFSSKSLI